MELNAETVELTAGDGYILCPCTRHHYYSVPRRPWRKVWFNVQGDLVAHLFKEEYQVTPYHYYLSRRLEIAQNLLFSTNMPIQEIFRRLGFPDYRHFSNLIFPGSRTSPLFLFWFLISCLTKMG